MRGSVRRRITIWAPSCVKTQNRSREHKKQLSLSRRAGEDVGGMNNVNWGSISLLSNAYATNYCISNWCHIHLFCLCLFFLSAFLNFMQTTIVKWSASNQTWYIYVKACPHHRLCIRAWCISISIYVIYMVRFQRIKTIIVHCYSVQCFVPVAYFCYQYFPV